MLANESKGVTQSQPKIEEKPEPDAIDIQGKNAKIKPKKKQETVTKKATPQPEPEPEEQSGCVRRRRPGQRSLWDVQCGRREGRIWFHRGRR